MSIILWYRSAADVRTSVPPPATRLVSISPPWFKTSASATPAHWPYVGLHPPYTATRGRGASDLVRRDCRADWSDNIDRYHRPIDADSIGCDTETTDAITPEAWRQDMRNGQFFRKES